MPGLGLGHHKTDSMNTTKNIWFLALVLGLLPLLLPGQQQQALELPRVIREKLGRSTGQIPHYRLPTLPLRAIMAQDSAQPGTRFAAPLPADVGLEQGGRWENLDNGDRIWRLTLSSEGALGLVLLCDQFHLPTGSQLRLYLPDGRLYPRIFTPADNTPSGKLTIGVIPSSTVVLEYYEPAAVSGLGQLHLFRVDHAYHRDNLQAAGFITNETMANFGFGTSSPCNLNVNCPEGEAWATPKRGIVRILLVVEEGTGFCTGSLVNNTKQDGRPLILSAYHCQDFYTPIYDLWRFDFNFETTGCTDPTSEPAYQSILGCQLLAGQQTTDFLLLELGNKVPRSFNAYFLGWNRQNNPPNRSAIIHHPFGDIKKISIDNQAAFVVNTTINWNNQVTSPAGSHLSAAFERGIFQTGSSGGPLLDPEQRIVGQLHGGIIPKRTCDSVAIGRFGRLAVAWAEGTTPAGRLRDWLDPDNSGVNALSGLENPGSSNTGSIRGTVRTEAGKPIPNARVSLLGETGLALAVNTGEDGQYLFDEVPLGDTYTINVSKTGVALNGVTTFDLIKVQKHVLNLENLSLLKQLAADVNLSRNISTLDLILMRRIVLGLDQEFNDVLPWYFLSLRGTFNVPDDPFSGVTAGANRITNFSASIANFDFIGIKYGDVNDSVDPTK